MSQEQKIDRILSCTNMTELQETEAKCCKFCNRKCGTCRIEHTLNSVRDILSNK